MGPLNLGPLVIVPKRKREGKIFKKISPPSSGDDPSVSALAMASSTILSTVLIHGARGVNVKTSIKFKIYWSHA